MKKQLQQKLELTTIIGMNTTEGSHGIYHMDSKGCETIYDVWMKIYNEFILEELKENTLDELLMNGLSFELIYEIVNEEVV